VNQGHCAYGHVEVPNDVCEVFLDDVGGDEVMPLELEGRLTKERCVDVERLIEDHVEDSRIEIIPSGGFDG